MWRGISSKAGVAAVSAAVLLSGLVGPVQAGQPFSESLVECAAIMNASRGAMPDGATAKTEARKARIRRQEQRFLQAAIRRAEAEGVADVDAYLTGLVAEKSGKWGGKGITWFMTQEFRDWASYCRAFGREMGVPPLDED